MISRSPKTRPSEYGMNDYYKFYKKNYPYKVERKIYNSVITDLNKFVVEEIVDTSKEFMLPHRVGYVLITKSKRGVIMLPDNTIINTAPPDWKSTIELWNKDPEAKEKKIIVKYKNTHTGGYVYNIKYNKYNATYKNKSTMVFLPTRDFKRAVAKRINDYSKEKYNAHEIKI